MAIAAGVRLETGLVLIVNGAFIGSTFVTARKPNLISIPHQVNAPELCGAFSRQNSPARRSGPQQATACNGWAATAQTGTTEKTR
jgi:hypothetical protein